MTQEQKALLLKLSQVLEEVAEECGNDEKFHAAIIRNNDLIPMSVDELAAEWAAVAHEDRK